MCSGSTGQTSRARSSATDDRRQFLADLQAGVVVGIVGCLTLRGSRATAWRRRVVARALVFDGGSFSAAPGGLLRAIEAFPLDHTPAGLLHLLPRLLLGHAGIGGVRRLRNGLLSGPVFLLCFLETRAGGGGGGSIY
jgi:hypothetical protein